MCGIIGIASKDRVTNPNWLTPGRNAIRHRGPDDMGEWWSRDGRVGLGHQRLAILDLSDAGHQPMQDIAEELCIAFNGEIYNFKELRKILSAKGFNFRSKTDTEVILAAYQTWGTDCLSHFNGMFSFAIYDLRRKQLFLARDRAGEKPLFYATTKETIRFSSELKGLMADDSFSRQIDPDAMDCYLSMGFVPGERCILQGVKKLPPAHALTFNIDSGESRVWRYWDLPEVNTHSTCDAMSQKILLDELENLLQDAVHKQLVADVPVGVLLSGGLDSSLITAMAVRSSPRVKTFTISFPGYGKYDETEHARLIAGHFGTEHLELEAKAGTIDLLENLAAQCDEPVIDSSIIPTYLVSRLVREHCTVALGGDGGDELFGGYRHYNRLLWLQKRFGYLPCHLRHIIAKVAQRVLPVGFKGRNWLGAMDTDFNREVPLIASYFDPGSRYKLFGNYSTAPGIAENIYNKRLALSGDFLQRATRMDFENYLPEDLLVKIDRTSMLNSLEVRSPMLDFRMIEFAYRKVPSQLKATATNRKILLKQLAMRVLPPKFDLQRKQGFMIPLALWLKSGPWLELFREVLLDNSQTIFDHHAIESLFKGLKRNYDNGERLFGLVMFELWRRNYKIEI